MRQIVVPFVLLVAMAFAAEDSEVSLIPNEFYVGAVDHPVPEKLARDVRTRDFVRGIAAAVGRTIADFMLEYHQQAFRAAPIIKSDLETATERVLNGEDVEKNLKAINTLIQTVVASIPGNAQIKRVALPPLPSPNGPVETHLGNEGSPAIFTNFQNLIDRDFVIVRNLIDSMYLAGWENARLSYTKVQDEFRSKFLNGDLLPYFASQLAKINTVADSVRGKVSSETWEEFVRLSGSIKTAHDSLTK